MIICDHWRDRWVHICITCYVWHILSHCAYFIVCFFSFRSADVSTCKNNQPFETQISTPRRCVAAAPFRLRLEVARQPNSGVFRSKHAAIDKSIWSYGGFLKWWVSPTTHGVFLLKMISTWGVKWGYPHLRKHPYMIQTGNISPATTNQHHVTCCLSMKPLSFQAFPCLSAGSSAWN